MSTQNTPLNKSLENLKDMSKTVSTKLNTVGFAEEAKNLENATKALIEATKEKHKEYKNTMVDKVILASAARQIDSVAGALKEFHGNSLKYNSANKGEMDATSEAVSLYVTKQADYMGKLTGYIKSGDFGVPPHSGKAR